MTSHLDAQLLNQLRAYAQRRVPDHLDPDDLLQDVLVRFLAAPEPIRAPRAWLFRTLRHALVDLYRVPHREHALEPDSPEPVEPQPEDNAVTDFLAGCVRNLLTQLNDSDRTTLQRVDLEGASQTRLALAWGLSPPTLKSRVQRARRRLRRLLEDCCRVELDVRGRPRSYQQKTAHPCACGGSQ